MAYKILTSFNELDSSLDSISDIQTAFFSLPAIEQAWWESHQRPELKIIELTTSDGIVGVLPLGTFDKGKTLQFLGDQDVSDYLDWIVKDPQSAGKALNSFLSEDSNWQKIHLVSLPEHSTLIEHLKLIAQKHKWNFQLEQQDITPIIQLPKTWEEYLQQVGKKQRHEIQRKLKRIQEQVKVSFRIITRVSQNLTYLEDFFRLHQQSSIEKARFWTDEHKKYFEKLSLAAEAGGFLRLYFLDINDEPAAVMYCFEYAESLLVYNSGFNAEKFLELSPGQVLTAFTIQDAISRGKEKYDFLRGGEQYKFRYGAVGAPVFNLTLTR